MGVSLHSLGERERCFETNIFSWRKLLALAKEYGWKPMGTDKPKSFKPQESWDGNYLTNECQTVKEKDASALAQALEMALFDMENSVEPNRKTSPCKEITEDPMIQSLMREFGEVSPDLRQKMERASTVSPANYFRNGGEGLVMGFIEFCRKGSFVIN